MRTRTLIVAGLAALSLVVAGCGEKEVHTTSDESSSDSGAAKAPAKTTAEPAEAAPMTKPKIKVPSGPPPKDLVIKDITKGTGTPVKSGDNITVNYIGVGYSDGKAFDNSYDRGQPFPLQLGAGMVIPGWDKGIVGMKVGGRRQLIIPAPLAYGAQGSPPSIKPNETLIFDVDLLSKQ
jgi:peptidylprolyl isomerase